MSRFTRFVAVVAPALIAGGAQAQTPTQGLDPPFETCDPQATGPLRIGSRQFFKNCSSQRLTEEYGSIYARYTLPAARDFSTASSQ